MPDFVYTARQTTGEQITGRLSAANQHDALGQLASMSLFPLRLDLSAETKTSQQNVLRRVKPKYLAVFYTQLADLLKAGVPLLRSLQLLERQTSQPSLKAVISEVADSVADGSPLAESMAQHPKAFGQLAVSMIRAGEEGGFLEDVLKRTSAFTEHQEELKSRVIGAMVYPMFLMGAGLMVIIAMFVFFVPKFEPIFERMSERGMLPWATTALMGLSDFLRDYGIVAALFVAAAITGLVVWIRSPEGRLAFDRFRISSLKIGNVHIGIGPLVRSLAIARFCRILGTMLRNGVPILNCLRISKDATGNLVLAKVIGRAAEDVQSGNSLANPLRASKQFPEEIVEMISVGEEANNLEQVLIDVADNMERIAHRRLDLFVRLLEPILLLFMAAIVLFVVIALMLPILQSSSVL